MEKQLKLQLGEAYCRQEEAQKSLQTYRKIRANSPSVQGSVDVAELLHGAAYIEVLDKRIAGQQEQVVKAMQEVNEKRGQVQSAMKERKLLDRLRERRLVIYKYNQAGKEQKQLDEAAGNIFYRKRAD